MPKVLLYFSIKPIQTICNIVANLAISREKKKKVTNKGKESGGRYFLKFDWDVY